MVIHLANSTTYYDIHLLAGYAAGKSVVLHNETSTRLLVAISPTAPVSDSNAIVVEVGDTYSFSPKTFKLWVKGSTGPIHVELLSDPASSSFERVEFSTDLYTSDAEGFRRLRVDPAQTGFFEGREFRTFFEFNIGAGQAQVFKFVSPIDFILEDQVITVDGGGIRFQALVGATEVATFNTPLPIVGKNRMLSRKQPYYDSVITINTHAAPVALNSGVTGGTVVEVARVVAANATSQQQTVNSGGQSERGLPAGTYYLRLHNFSNGAATGVYTLIWEERP